jgi:DNA replication protein DnaC
MTEIAPGWTRDALMAAFRNGVKVPDEVLDRIAAVDLDAMRDELREERWRWVRERAGVPKRLWDAGLALGDRTPALERVREYVAGERQDGCCLVLTGPTGVGKSYAAVAAMHRFPIREQRFWYFPALCGALLDPARRNSALENVKAMRFAVLDDFGVEYVKDGGIIETFLDEIIWAREAESLPTIITTNLTTDALKARLSDRLVDRLRGEWGRIFECPGQSLRAPR